MIVLAGTIITKSEFDWPAFALVIITATATYGIARLQFASFRQSIRKARETEERARTAQAVLRSFEESGNNWLWETDENGLLTYVSPQFGRVLDRDCHELAGKRLVDLFGRRAEK